MAGLFLPFLFLSFFPLILQVVRHGWSSCGSKAADGDPSLLNLQQKFYLGNFRTAAPRLIMFQTFAFVTRFSFARLFNQNLIFVKKTKRRRFIQSQTGFLLVQEMETQLSCSEGNSAWF